MLRFTTQRALRILKRLRLVAAHTHRAEMLDAAADAERRESPQAEALRPHIEWVALAGPTEVLVAADTPQEVLAWLARHERKASYGMFRVPASMAEAEGAVVA